MNKPLNLVRDLMSPDVLTLERNEKLLVADDVMRLGRIRHLPVVDEDGKLCGIVSQRDLFHNGVLKALGYGTHAQRSTLEALVVKEAMSTGVVTVSPDMALAAAAKLMFEKKIGCLVVLDADKIVGILTEGDFVRLAAGV